MLEFKSHCLSYTWIKLFSLLWLLEGQKKRRMFLRTPIWVVTYKCLGHFDTIERTSTICLQFMALSLFLIYVRKTEVLKTSIEDSVINSF